jgi:hypothetical protein
MPPWHHQILIITGLVFEHGVIGLAKVIFWAPGALEHGVPDDLNRNPQGKIRSSAT